MLTLQQDTLYDSAGYADVITTVFGGRNARVAAEFVRQGGKKNWNELEKEMLGGQKLQVRLTRLIPLGLATSLKP